MTSADTRAHDEAIVRELHGRGLSIRAIAKQAGFSRPNVDRILARLARPFGADTGLSITVDDDGDDYAEPEALPGDDYEPIAPFTFVGLATPEDRHGNPLKDGNGRVFPPGPRAVDGRGVAVCNPELDIWRWCAHADAEGDSEGAERVRTDWARQLAEAGVFHDDARGRWVQT